MKEMWKLAVKGEFSAAHALRHYQGKCENPHGHNFTVEITVQGDRLDPLTGILVDFKVLKNGLAGILKNYDHCMLNDQPLFQETNPSSENLAKSLWRDYECFLASLPEKAAASLKLLEVKVSEKDGQTAAYTAS